MTGISQAQISRYEKGENEPTAEILVVLSRVLDVSTDWLLNMTDDERPIHKELSLSSAERAALNAWRSGNLLEAVRIIVKENR